ncbi:hypothetical protein vseg_020388 [Gypsophila vaccaria]
MNVGGDGGFCSVDGVGKDDYVIANDSDVNDHKNVELNVAELSVKEGDDMETDTLEDGVEEDGGEPKIEDGVDQEKENGEIESKGESVEVLSCGDDSKVEVLIAFSVEVSEVRGSSDLEPVLDEVKEISDPKLMETSGNGIASVDGIDSRSLDVDDKSKDDGSAEIETDGAIAVNGVPDAPEHFEVYNCELNLSGAQESAEVEADSNTTVNGVTDAPGHFEVEVPIEAVTVEVPEGELKTNQLIVQPLNNNVDQTGKPEHEVTANNDEQGNVFPVSELESADCVASKLKPVETSVSDESVENVVTEAQPLDGDANNLDADLKTLPLDNATSVEQSAQPYLSPSDGENEKQDLTETEVKIDELSDGDAVAAGGSQESVDSEAAGYETDSDETGEVTDQNGSDLSAEPEETTHLQPFVDNSEGEQDWCNLESTRMENSVPVSSDQSDESINSSSGVEESSKALTAEIQLDTMHISAIESKAERVDGDGESEVMADSGGTQEAVPEEDVLKYQMAGRTGSFDAVETCISSQDCSTEKPLRAEDTITLSKAQSADQNDLGCSPAKDDVSENKVVPTSAESLEDGGSVMSEDKNSSLDSTEPAASCDSNTLNEQGVVDGVHSVTDNSPSGSVDATCSQTELENGKCSVPYPVYETKSGTKSVNNGVDAAIKSNNISGEALRPKISFGSFDFISPFPHSEINLASDAQNKCSADSPSSSGTKVYPSNGEASVINLGSDALNKSTAGSASSSESKIYRSNGVALPNSHTNGDHFAVLNHNGACAQVVRPEPMKEGLASSAKRAEADLSDSQNINPDFVRRPLYWLVKIPRADNGIYGEQLTESEMKLAEKTQTRNACQAQFYKHQAYCRELKSNLEAAKLEAKAAHELMMAKKREVDSDQSLINLGKHAVTVDNIDDQALKKELNALRDNLSKADEQVRAAQKKHDDESAFLNDLKHQLISANDIRQEAFVRSITLKKQLNEKNTHFYKAKNEVRAAYHYAAAGKLATLESHCLNQVENIMEMWNKNDEFRHQYVECNSRRMLWKFGTFDGTRLGINEVPPSFLRDVSENRVHTSAKINSSAAVLTLRKDVPVDTKVTEDRLPNKVEQKKASPNDEKNDRLPNKAVQKKASPNAEKNDRLPNKVVQKKAAATAEKNVVSKDSLAKASSNVEVEEVKEETKLTKEEEEFARKAEETRREEEAARLREQRKLEEKAKAEKALEKKKRNVLKAQARAEFRARKEAEEREKARELREKKKQKKLGLDVDISENEPAQPPVPSFKSAKEPEVTEKPTTAEKRPKKAPLQTKVIKTIKPIPLALRNKGKRGLLHYWPYPLIMLLALGLFYLGSVERIQTIEQLISGLFH